MSPRGCGRNSHTPCFKTLFVLHGHTFPVLEFTGIRPPHLSTDTELFNPRVSHPHLAGCSPPRVALPPTCSQA